MTTIEEQIRRLADIAEAAGPRPARHRRRGRRRSGTPLVVGAIIGLLVGAAVVGVLTRSPARDRDIASAPSTEAWERERSYDVVEATLSQGRGAASVDVGSDDGLQPGVGVYGDGLMGVVDEVRATSSTVRLLGSDDVAVRATVTYTDALGGDHDSGFSTIEGTVRTIDDMVVFTADEALPDDLATRLAGAAVGVAGGPGSLLQAKVPIGTIDRPTSPDDQS